MVSILLEWHKILMSLHLKIYLMKWFFCIKSSRKKKGFINTPKMTKFQEQQVQLQDMFIIIILTNQLWTITCARMSPSKKKSSLKFMVKKIKRNLRLKFSQRKKESLHWKSISKEMGFTHFQQKFNFTSLKNILLISSDN